MIGPYGAGSFRETMQWACEIYQALRSVLMESLITWALEMKGVERI